MRDDRAFGCCHGGHNAADKPSAISSFQHPGAGKPNVMPEPATLWWSCNFSPAVTRRQVSAWSRCSGPEKRPPPHTRRSASLDRQTSFHPK